ncbi:hypothetical protein GJAV_G00235830 [Gymnothorax javanicus]|nr:hypothetical protein GJAV_G00235830 [Gymnothorax javanicus]
MPYRQGKTKLTEEEGAKEEEKRESDIEVDTKEIEESEISQDSSSFIDFLEGKDPDFECDSDEDWEPEVQRREESAAGSSTSTPQRGKTPVGAARRARGRTPKSSRGGRRRAPDPQATAGAQTWLGVDTEDPMPPQPTFRPARTPGPQIIQEAKYTILQLFQLFITNSILRTVVENTNRFGAMLHGTKWQIISMEDIYSYLAILIYMGLFQVPAITDYWRQSKLYNLAFPRSVISGRKFQLIATSIHLSNPDDDKTNEAKRGTAAYDRLTKIKPMYEEMRVVCKANFHPYQHICVDERMVASKARISLKQYMKNKPCKWGYKLFVLADSCNGYTWDFFVYEGKSHILTGKGLGYDSVMALVSTQHLGTGYKLYVDNFYTSPELFRDLLQLKIWACGTIRSNGRGYPKDLAGMLARDSPRGSIRWIRDGSLLFVQWRDTRDVQMCSTMHQAHADETVKRRVKGPDGQWSLENLSVPPAIKDYNRHMGGVDLSDALIGFYNVLHKTKRWYRSLFYHFIDIAIVNAFIIHKESALKRGERPLTQKAFREKLVLQLAEVGSPTTVPQPPPVLAAGMHIPVYRGADATQAA